MGAQDAQDTARRLRAIGDELSDRFYERADVVRTLVVTLLAGQHSLVLGPPGTAKSEMARELTGRIDGASYWEILLSKFTAPTRMFGPIDVAALARGEYRQVYDGRATTAHVAFIDEIFKCSTAALNETLGFLNERIYHPENGGEPIRCPLIGAITASNELPTGEDSAAIYDRLLVRVEVGYLTDPPTSPRSSAPPSAAPRHRPAPRSTWPRCSTRCPRRSRPSRSPTPWSTRCARCGRRCAARNSSPRTAAGARPSACSRPPRTSTAVRRSPTPTCRC